MPGTTAPKSQDRLKQLLPDGSNGGLVASKALYLNLRFGFLNRISLLLLSSSYPIFPFQEKMCCVKLQGSQQEKGRLFTFTELDFFFFHSPVTQYVSCSRTQFISADLTYLSLESFRIPFSDPIIYHEFLCMKN